MREEQGFEIEKEDIVVEEVEENKTLDVDGETDNDEKLTENMHNIAGVLSSSEKNSSSALTIIVVIAVIVLGIAALYGFLLG